jgi:hypothetical protein
MVVQNTETYSALKAHNNIQSGNEVDIELHTSSRKFETRRLETDFIKLLISIQKGGNLFNVSSHITRN